MLHGEIVVMGVDPQVRAFIPAEQNDLRKDAFHFAVTGDPVYCPIGGAI